MATVHVQTDPQDLITVGMEDWKGRRWNRLEDLELHLLKKPSLKELGEEE